METHTKNPYLFCLALLLLVAGHSGMAQQNRFNWRFGVGVGNQFDGGVLFGKDSAASPDVVKLETEYLSYSAFLELSLSQDFGIKAFAQSEPGAIAVDNAGLLLAYYFDNGYLLSQEAFIAPYINAGLAFRPGPGYANLPFGGGIKVRMGNRVNLNIDVTANTRPDRWSEGGYTFANEIRAYSSVALHYNFGRKDHAYKAPRPYVSPYPNKNTSTSVETPASVKKRPRPISPVQSSVTKLDTLDILEEEGKPMDSVFAKSDSLRMPVLVDTVFFYSHQLDSAGKADFLARYSKILTVPEVGDSLRLLNFELEDTTTRQPESDSVASQWGFAMVPAGDTVTEISRESDYHKNQDSTLADLEYQVRKQKLENELKLLQEAGRDSTSSYLLKENQRLQSQLQTSERFNSLEQRVNRIENEPTSTAGTANNQSPIYAPQSGPTSSGTSNYNNPPGNSDNSFGSAGAGAVAGGVIATGSNAGVDRLEDKIDSLQQQLNRMQNQLRPAVPGTPIVAGIKKDTAVFDSNQTMTDSATVSPGDSLPVKYDTVKVYKEPGQSIGKTFTDEEFKALKEDLAKAQLRIDSLLQINRRRTAEPGPGEKKEAPAPKTFFGTTGKVEVFFAVSSSTLDSGSKKKLNDALQFAKNRPQATFLIKGFTDKTGSVAFNRRLADRRAASVVDYLKARGLDASRIKVVNMGQDQSLGTGSQSYGRRVEVELN